MAEKAMRVGITGASGFIGSHLARHLKDRPGVEVTALPRSKTTGAFEPVILSRLVGELDVIYHLAGVNRGNGAELINGNVLATWNLVDAIQRSGNRSIHLVFASSGQIYHPSARPIQETRKIVPPTLYGATKKAAEDLIRLSGLPYTVMRLSNVYGPGCRSEYNSVIATFCDRALRGLPLVLHGDGAQGRDFIYIDDVVRALTLAAETPSRKGNIFNLCSGRMTTLHQLARTIARQVPGTRIEFEPGVSTGPAAYCLDGARFRQRFHWKPKVSLVRGLERTLAALSKKAS